MRDFTSELLRREIARPLHPRRHGRAALVAAGPCAAVDQHPTHGQIHSLPTHGLAREVPAPPSAHGVRTGLPRWLALAHNGPDIGRGARPARPLGTPRPRAARLSDAPRRGRAAGDVGPYHCPTRTHLAPTILPPAPTWPLPFSHPHPLDPLPLSRPHPLGPYHCPARHPLGLYHCPTRTHSVPTLALQRPRARSTRAALGAGCPLSPTPCVHPRAPHPPRNSPPKNLNFFCHRRMPTAYIHVPGFARICAAPNKTRGIRRFGRRVRRVYFFSRPPCAYGGCVVYSWRL